MEVRARVEVRVRVEVRGRVEVRAEVDGGVDAREDEREVGG